MNYTGLLTDFASADMQILHALTLEMTDYNINRPERILMDPKLFGPLMICYGSFGFDYDSLSSILSQNAFMDFSLLVQSDEQDPSLTPYDRITSFNSRRHRGQSGLQSLWLWQCQNLVLSQPQTSVALQVDFIYNYVRFMYLSLWERPRPLDVSDVEATFMNESRKIYGDQIFAIPPPFEKWRLVLSGFWCVVAGRLGFGLNELPERSWSLWKKFDQEYRLYEPRGPSQLFPDDLLEFDASFICSGPFKLELTNDFRDHLKFKKNDSLIILLYYDQQPCPGSNGRGCIFKGNIFADGFSPSS